MAGASDGGPWPLLRMRFLIVTPSFNSGGFIAATMESVLNQEGDFDLEYHVMDGGSTDGTVETARSYERRLRARTWPIRCRSAELQVHSEPDRGLYDAIRKGFARGNGDVLAWLNSDDLYLPGALRVVQQVFEKFPAVRWQKGITSYVDEAGKLIQRGELQGYHRPWILEGSYGRDWFFIQQDSVFWRRDLWEEAGGLAADWRLAGDYDLWVRFARFAPLVAVDAEVSCFRKRPGQLSGNAAAYQDEVLRRGPVRGGRAHFRRWLYRIYSRLPRALRSDFYRLALPHHELPVVRFDHAGEPRLTAAFAA